jgi:hypothetical protein
MFKVFNEQMELIGRTGGETVIINEGMTIIDDVYKGDEFIGWIVEE